MINRRLLFRLDDGSVTRHAGERKDKSSSSDETESVLSEAASRYGIEFDGLGLREVDTDDEMEELEEDGDGSGDDEDEDDGAQKEAPAVSIAAFQLSSIPEAESDNESNTPPEDLKHEDSSSASPACLESTEETTKECVGRLTAKERRLLKKAKSKGDVALVPVSSSSSVISATQSSSMKAMEGTDALGEEGDGPFNGEGEDEDEDEDDVDSDEDRSRSPLKGSAPLEGTAKKLNSSTSNAEDI